MAAPGFSWRQIQPPDTLPAAGRAFPRGRISELVGGRSAGCTSLLHALLAASTSRGEFAAMVDTQDAFDPQSAAAAGVELDRLVWIRCGGNAEHALRAADLLIHAGGFGAGGSQAGGFGVVALDLAEVPPRELNRIPPTAWFRFRRAVQDTPTILAVVASQGLAKSCSAMTVKMPPRRAVFSGRVPYLLLESAQAG